MKPESTATAPEQRRGRSPAAEAWRRFRRRRVALAALFVVFLLYFTGIFAPWIAPHSYTDQDLGAANQGPSLAHPLGTDRLGRDLLSRIIWGARTAAIVSLAAVSLGTLFGILIGVAAGYFRGWVDTSAMRLSDILFAFPSLLLVIFIAATVKPTVVGWVREVEDALNIRGLVRSGLVDYVVVFGALSFFAWPGMARLVRGQVLSLREYQFVEAARALGASPRRILLVHLLPNALSPVLVAISMSLGSAVTSEVVLSWLGIGIQPPNPSWGAMIWENSGMLRAHPHLLLVPVGVVSLVIFAFNLLGDALNDALNPKVR